MKKIDKSNMRQTILDFPKQFKVGLASAKNTKISGKFKKILICGMGGSALPADILSIWFNTYKIALPLHIHRNYNLPYQVNKKHLIICISYSGNTEETLTCFKEAHKRKFKVVVITSGGKLAQLCEKYKIPIAIIPKGFQPRMALGFQFAALMRILANGQIIKNDLSNISALEKSLNPRISEALGKKIAQKLKGKTPVIYAAERLKSLAMIWKIKFNENSKIPAFYNYFPELNHNEIVGFDKSKKNIHLIILRDPADHPRILKRMKLIAYLIRKRKMGIDIIDIKGQDILYKIFSSILLADWASYYLALALGVDPTPVKINDEFKKKLLSSN